MGNKESDKMWLRSNHITESNPDVTIDQIDTSLWFQCFEDGKLLLSLNIDLGRCSPDPDYPTLKLVCDFYYDDEFNEVEFGGATAYNTSPLYASKNLGEYDWSKGLFRTKEFNEYAAMIVQKYIDGTL